MNEKGKLRVGLLLDGMEVRAWVYRMVEILQRSDYAAVELLVVDGGGEAERPSLVRRITGKARNLLPVLLNKGLDIAEQKLVERGASLPDAFAPRDLSPLVEGVPVLTVKPVRKRVSDYFSSQDVAAIEQHRLDVLIRIGFRILRGGILHAARYGVWSYHHGDNRVNRGGPAAYWEVVEGWPETGSMLQILSEDIDNGKVLYRSWSCTQETVADNRNNLYWKTLSFIPRRLEQLRRLGEEEFFRRMEAENPPLDLYGNRLFTVPTRSERARHIVRRTLGKLRDKYANKFYFDQWFLLYHLGDDGWGSLWRYRSIHPPKDRFWADPFPVYRDGRYYLFIEEFLFDRQQGHIAVLEMDEEGNWSEPVPVLERPYHLSYPFVFQFEGEYYMVPESAANRSVDLYHCVEFPHRWEHRRTLLKGVSAVDATLHRQDGRWWMFVSIAENEGASSCDELFLFHSDDLLQGEWIPHPENPVVSDVRRARPAGRIFRHDGRLYRPSQNCAGRYGYGFQINEILRLDETGYEERPIATATPDWRPGLLATHTFNRAGRLTVIDAEQRRRF